MIRHHLQALTLLVVVSIRTSDAQYISRPDLSALDWNVSYTAPGADISQGYLYLATRVDPYALYIVNCTSGEPAFISQNPVWLNATETDIVGAFNWRPQLLNGSLVNTFWSGHDAGAGYGFGRTIILDQSYTVIYNVSDSPTVTQGSSGNTDIHESRLTSNGTLLVTQYRTVYDYNTTGNLSEANGYIVGAAFQEQDLNGTVLFDWAGLDHGVDVSECKNGTLAGPGTEEAPFDYAHINSVFKDGLGNYLLSMRHTWTIYYVSGEDGSILWRLGGFVSNFTDDGTGSQAFAWQHDAQFIDEGDLTYEELSAAEQRTISLFDNAATTFAAATTSSDGSAGMLIDLYLNNMTSSLRTRYNSPGGDASLLSISQGSLQIVGQDQPYIDDGNSANEVVMGYGQLASTATYDRNGTSLQLIQINASESYRTFKVSGKVWSGYPLTPVDVAWAANNTDNYTLAVSWNGASDVRTWRVDLYDETATSVKTLGHLKGYLFESIIQLVTTSYSVNTTAFTYIQVSALSAEEILLAQSPRLALNGTSLGGELSGTFPSRTTYYNGTTPNVESQPNSTGRRVELNHWMIIVLLSFVSTLFFALATASYLP